MLGEAALELGENKGVMGVSYVVGAGGEAAARRRVGKW